MKKFILSTIVILVFIAYALNQKMGVIVVSKSASGTPLVFKPTLASSPKPVSAPAPTSVVVDSGKYRNGNYTGSSADAYYGTVQVKTVIQSGQIADVIFLNHPQDRGTSIRINDYAMPILKSEAIQAQSANVDTVSGASYTSAAFRQSLGSALAQALN